MALAATAAVPPVVFLLGQVSVCKGNLSFLFQFLSIFVYSIFASFYFCPFLFLFIPEHPHGISQPLGCFRIIVSEPIKLVLRYT